MGFGRSDKPAQLYRYTLQAHVNNAVALIDELDLRDVTLVAHDWGGPIGLGAMLERSDRLRDAVLVNTWAWELPSFVPSVHPRAARRRASASYSSSAATSSSSRSPAAWPGAIRTP